MSTTDEGSLRGNAEDVIASLRRRYDELTQSQKRIAELIVDDPGFVSFATVDKVAARLSVSPSTIVRFAYRMGLAGYPELQEQVRGKLLKDLRAADADAEDGAVAHLGRGIVAGSLSHDVDILATTMQRTNARDVEQAISTLAGARRLRIIGGMTSFSVAYYAAVALDRVRPGVSLLGGEPLPTGALLDLDRGDAVLAFSFPPYAKSTLDAVRAAKARGASVVAISDSPIAPLRDSVDFLLPAVVTGVGMQNSYVAAMALANAIANGMTLAVPDALERYGDTVRLLANWDVYLLPPVKDR